MWWGRGWKLFRVGFHALICPLPVEFLAELLPLGRWWCREGARRDACDNVGLKLSHAKIMCIILRRGWHY
jgi:hypothetical protein